MTAALGDLPLDQRSPVWPHRGDCCRTAVWYSRHSGWWCKKSDTQAQDRSCRRPRPKEWSVGL